MEYLTRTTDSELDELLPGLAAIALEGAKGVGKTETARRRARTVLALDDPVERQLLSADPRRLLSATPPVLVDEWQRHPPVWDAVRRAVDADRSPGRFLLTGSATPPPGTAIHSGAGRILPLRMRPLTLQERGVAAATVSLRHVLHGHREALEGRSTTELADYVEEILASGFPGIRDLPSRPRRAALDGYLERIIDRDFPDQDLPVRRPAALRSWLTAYAAATATNARHQAILDASTPGEADKPARSTVVAYREVLQRLWLIDPVPGWAPGLNELTRLQQAPKHHLADPALAARLLGVTGEALLAGQGRALGSAPLGLLGALFESLATLCVRVAAQAAESRVHHLRDRNGKHEVDLIVERDDRCFVAIEIKLAGSVTDHDVRHLRWLRDRAGDLWLDGIVLTAGPYAYRRRDGIGVVPLSLLGA